MSMPFPYSLIFRPLESTPRKRIEPIEPYKTKDIEVKPYGCYHTYGSLTDGYHYLQKFGCKCKTELEKK